MFPILKNSNSAGAASAQNTQEPQQPVTPEQSSTSLTSKKYVQKGKFNQWAFYVSESKEHYVIINSIKPLPDVVNSREELIKSSQYYAATDGEYGQPLIVPEPQKQLPIPNIGVTYTRKGTPFSFTKEARITGLIIKNAPYAQAQTLVQTSLTPLTQRGIKFDMNATTLILTASDPSKGIEIQGGKFVLSDDSSTKSQKFSLYGLFNKDKNRITSLTYDCLDAYFTPKNDDDNNNHTKIIKYKELDDVM
jgi:hypothetical protein